VPSASILRETYALRCVISLPGRHASCSGPWRVLCFLHGDGEAADYTGPGKLHKDCFAALHAHGPLRFGSSPRTNDFIVVAPQLPGRGGDVWKDYAVSVKEILLALNEEFNADLRRTYLSGFSYGANGVFEITDLQEGSGRHCGPWTRRDLLGKTPGVLQCGCGMERTLNRVMKRPRVGLSRSDRRKNTRWVINWLAKRVRGMCQRLSRLTRTAVFTDGCQRRRVSELHFIQFKTATGAKVQRSRSKAIALGLTCWRQSRCCPHTIARPLQPFTGLRRTASRDPKKAWLYHMTFRNLAGPFLFISRGPVGASRENRARIVNLFL
jgi:hypothetical protein